MKSARERAIDVYYAFTKTMVEKPMSRKLLGMMIEEQVSASDPVGITLAALEKEIETDRRELLAWSKEEG